MECKIDFFSSVPWLHTKQCQSFTFCETLLYFFTTLLVYVDDIVLARNEMYCLELVGDSGFLGLKPISTPMDASCKLLDNDTTTHPRTMHYQETLTVIHYLKGTLVLRLFFSTKNEHKDTISCLSSEAEYKALASLTCELQ
ncbi:hypothetical protein CR513_52210, partial [Mucuna pruriens]